MQITFSASSCDLNVNSFVCEQFEVRGVFMSSNESLLGDLRLCGKLFMCLFSLFSPKLFKTQLSVNYLEIDLSAP